MVLDPWKIHSYMFQDLNNLSSPTPDIVEMSINTYDIKIICRQVDHISIMGCAWDGWDKLSLKIWDSVYICPFIYYEDRSFQPKVSGYQFSFIYWAINMICFDDGLIVGQAMIIIFLIYSSTMREYQFLV